MLSFRFSRMARLGMLAATLAAGSTAAMAQTAICYNCPTEWADWGTQLKAIKAKTGITVPADNKNSGQSLAQLVAEKASPVADVTYLGVTFAVQAQKDGVVEPYKPAAWKDIPDGLKDPAGNWFTIHSGTLGFMVNVDALKGKPVPKSWADLLKPEYKGLIGYLDPASAFVGYVGAVAVNEARGGTLDNFAPAIDYFKALQKNEPIVPKQTSYARVLSGEIAILLDYDFNAYRALRNEPGRQGAACSRRQEGARLRAVRRGPGDLGQGLPAASARERDAEGHRGAVPACYRIRPREERGLRAHGRGAACVL